MSPAASALAFNPYAHDVHEDPFPFYRRLRDEAPAYYNDELDFWALSRYEDVLAALHDPGTYCSRHGITLEPRSPLPMMITKDPPEHTATRRLVSRIFTPRRIAELEPTILELSAKHMDPWRGSGHCDVIADYSAKLPMDVISVMLGVPDEDQDMIRGWTDAMIHREEGNPDVTEEGIAGATQLYAYFLEDVQRKRRGVGLGDDLTSGLVTLPTDDVALTDDDVVSFCFLLAIAGNETTTKLIGNAIHWLWRFPDERAKLLADRGRIPDAVEETLRYEGSTQLMARTLTTDVDLHGAHMRAGTRVLLLLGSANRDERQFPDPDTFDIDRTNLGHIAFGHGVHVCLGAALARLEARVALEHLLDELGAYEVDVEGMERIHSGNVRGYAHVPVAYQT